MQTRRHLQRLIAALALICWHSGSATGQAPASILVFAAADLGPPFKRIVPDYERQTNVKVTLVLGSTGTLTQQIRNGAPADVFFAANESYVQQLSAESLTLDQTRSLYARGQIVSVTLKSSALRVETLNDLAKAEVKHIAIANPTHAPYGLAAKQSLEAAGLWTAVANKLVYGENVQQAVQFVRSGSVEAGIVARSVADTPDLSWTLVDERLHAPLNQTAVVLARTKQPHASTDFITFVNGIQGRLVMRQFGFLLPGEF
ncbi:MAG TPA: molybdate ABC transporter substrate-binding protein [Vicinamibacterales bacterium]|nr:molybdate ABC transporter substrate-binding protein [Vicinamibacterales bacterium]